MPNSAIGGMIRLRFAGAFAVAGFFSRTGYRGLNLTIPHKVEVLPMIEQIDEEQP